MATQIDHDLKGSAYEAQFSAEDPPEGNDAAFDPEGGADDGANDGTAAPAPAPAPAAPAPAPAAPDKAKEGADPDDDAAAAPAPAPAPAPAAPGADDGAAAPAPAADPTLEGLEAVIPDRVLPATAPTDAADQIKAARDDVKEAVRLYGQGELSEEEFNERREAAEEKVQELRDAIAADKARQAAYDDQKISLWETKEDAAKAQLAAAGVKIEGENLADWAEQIRAFSRRANERGMVDGRNLVASQWVLNQATRVMLALHGKAPSPAPAPAPAARAAAAPAPTAPKKTQAQMDAERRQPPAPPTLAQAPVAAESAVSGGEFAHLANLEGTDLERAVARLTPEQEARYLGT